MSIPDFLGAFYFYETETLTDRWGQEIDVECQEIGHLILPTGSIVACDGLIPSTEPFAQKVTPGSYSVVLSLILSAQSQQVACAMLRFKDTMPQTWKRADAVDLEESHGSGYGVDTATGCFADLSAMLALLTAPEKYDRLREEVYRHRNNDWVDFRVSDDCNIIAFSSGEGDGKYPSYFGYDTAGNIVCLATDFGMIAPLPGRPTETPSKFQLKLDF